MFSQTYQKMILLFVSWMCLSMTSAFDITHILSQHPELSTFSNYLTQTNLAQDINSRQTITVLAVSNADMGPLAGKPMDQIKKILSVHVLLDYYDIIKLKTLREDPLTVATLLQASGQALAVNNQGFINVTFSGGQVGFGSAAAGVSRHTQALLVKPVESDPYSISVLQISAAIIPSGLNGRGPSSPPQIPVNGDSPTQDGQAPMQPPPTPQSPSPRKNAPTQPPAQGDHTPSHAPPQANHAPTQAPPQAHPTPAQRPKRDDHAPRAQPPKQDDHAPSAQPPKQDDHAPAQSPTSEPPTASPTHSPDAKSPTDGYSPSSSPSENAPSPSDGSAPEPSDADSPSDDDDSPSPSPTRDSPSPAPSNDSGDEPSSADSEEKKKKSAGGMIVPSSIAAWISAIILSVILGQLV